jgi:hypothetical protein
MSSPAAFFDAVYERNATRVRELLGTLGPIADRSEGVTAMRISVEKGYDDVTLAFLDGGTSLAVRDQAGSSPLTWAARVGNVALARELVKRGAHINATDELGWTALFHAAAAQELEMVQLLLDSGADAAVRDWEGKTPVDIARWRRYRLRLPFLGPGGGVYRTLFDSPVRSLLKKHLREKKST